MAQYFSITLPGGGTAHFHALDTTGMSGAAITTDLNNARTATFGANPPATFKKFEVDNAKNIQDWCEGFSVGLWPLISAYWYMLAIAINAANTFVWLDLTP